MTLAIVMFFSNVSVSMHAYAGKAELPVIGSARCVLCHVRGIPTDDDRMVWCDGPHVQIIIYDRLKDALADKRDGHCLHFSCLTAWLEQKQHCPVCKKIFSSSEKAGMDIVRDRYEPLDFVFIDENDYE